MIHLDYRDARPIYNQITCGILEQIRTGILQPGDRLPSVRELASQLTINPNTIQRAYRELEAEGHIVTVAGKGCFVCEPTPTHGDLAAQLQTLADAVAALTALGISREELAQRIMQGGNDHA